MSSPVIVSFSFDTPVAACIKSELAWPFAVCTSTRCLKSVVAFRFWNELVESESNAVGLRLTLEFWAWGFCYCFLIGEQTTYC